MFRILGLAWGMPDTRRITIRATARFLHIHIIMCLGLRWAFRGLGFSGLRFKALLSRML